MSNLTVEIKCSRCKQPWYQDLTRLNRQSVVYRGTTREEQYSAPCPNCGTYNVITVEIEDDDD